MVALVKPLIKFYYWFTAYVPRHLPRNESEFESLKYVLVNYYGIADNSKSWATVAGHLSSVPSHSLRRSYGFLANTAKRIVINEVIQKFRSIAIRELEQQLKEAFEKFQKENPEEKSETQASEILPTQLN